ncbi:hypothetical protein GT030_29560 [Streptomyces sp. SID1328]|uniref:hypothetical protein n=1 Tax=Streptomyces sp. SID1328 TaxID=2690250 RepID=UPI0013680A65|nr:hypothetical protein [Streptomyces sp. SID1328]MYV42901.1 hypothetical protein [Streptomyces sp. SID1328]
MDWNEQRRQDKAAAADQKRKDADAAAARAMQMRAAEDERRRANRQADKAERRAEQQQARRDKKDRRRERMQSWTKNTRPGVVYQRGTLALVTASALASLPAQVKHFVSISEMLLPLPFALEGAAWVMAAGVAYADEKGLPAWVRWLLRALSMAAAGYAATINYQYGAHIDPTAGYGLAAVTLLGPLFFEVRQWVTTLTVDAGERKRRAEEKARAEHDKRRRSHHKDVVTVAERLVSAAPFGALDFETAFAAAWEIRHGTRATGLTPELHLEAARSHHSLTQALAETGMSGEAAEVELLLADLFGPGRPDGGDHGGASARGGRPPKGPAGGMGTATATAPEKSAQGAASSQVDAHLSPRSKPTPPKRRRGDSPKFSPLARKAASREAKDRQSKP